MVQANNRKLENIEKFLENLGCKIESFFASDPGTLTKTKKRKADVVRVDKRESPMDFVVCVQDDCLDH